MRCLTTLLIIVLAFSAPVSRAVEIGDAQLSLENVFYPSGQEMVHAFLYKPKGNGPFPTVIFNQATKKPYYEKGSEYPFAALAQYFTSRGYVFFVSDRPAHKVNDEFKVSSFADLLQSSVNLSTTNRMLLQGFDLVSKDILASISWLRSQPYVNSKKMIMVGHSTGGIQTLLLGTQQLGLRGFVVFSPAAKLWRENDIMPELLTTAVKKSQAPIFLIQAQNDFCLGPSEVLGRELAAKGRPNTCKVYPPFGIEHTQAVMFGVRSPDVWGDDVQDFLTAVLQ